MPKSNWDNWEKDKKIFISPEGIETIIENEFVPKPYLIFFPDGQNSGGVLNIEFDSFVLPQATASDGSYLITLAGTDGKPIPGTVHLKCIQYIGTTSRIALVLRRKRSGGIQDDRLNMPQVMQTSVHSFFAQY